MRGGAAGSTARLGQLAAAVLVFHVANSVLQEAVFHLPGFHHVVFLSFLQVCCVALLAAADFRRLGLARRAPLWTYLLLSVLSTGSTLLTNEATRRINYPTQVIFKSSKLLFVMALRAAVVRGRGRSTRREVAGALWIVVGLIAFTWATSAAGGMGKAPARPAPRESHRAAHVAVAAAGGHVDVHGAGAGAGGRHPELRAPVGLHPVARVDPHLDNHAARRAADRDHQGAHDGAHGAHDPDGARGAAGHGAGGGPAASPDVALGVLAVVVALCFDAMLYIGQEKWCFAPGAGKSSETEVILFLNLFGVGHAALALLGSGQAAASVAYAAATPAIVGLVAAYSLCNFLGTTFLLRTVSEFGSSTAVVVTSTRKTVTVLLSFLIYPKPFGGLHALGVAAVAGGIYLHETARKLKKPPPGHTDSPPADPALQPRPRGMPPADAAAAV